MTVVSRYRGLVCDLDGVVYRGAQAVPYAVEGLEQARTSGVGVVYATNNASRPPAEVFAHLSELGLTLELADVVTSAMAGAHRLAELVPAGARVLAVGGDGVQIALEDEGLTAVRAGDLLAEGAEPVQGVLQGFGKQVSWVDLSEAAFAIQQGARWVASNTDFTIPTDRGIGPGNGTLVGVVRRAVDVDPEVVGKPFPPLYMRCAERLGCEPAQSLAIGDRLDTDIEGAVRTGMDSLFVFTGVDGPRSIIEAGPDQRPTYLARDLRGLAEEYVEPQVETGGGDVVATCGDARVVLSSARIETTGGGSASERLRAVVAAGIAHVDAGGTLPDWSGVDPWILEDDA